MGARPADRQLDRRIVALAVPALGALITEPLYNLVDTAIVGHLGQGPLAGLALAAAVLDVLGWVGGFLTSVTTSLVAFKGAAGDQDGQRRAVGAAYVLAIGLGAGLASLLVVGAGPVLAVSAASGAARRAGLTYLRIAVVGLPFLFIQFAGTGQSTGLADTRRPFVIALAANGLNVALEILLVYGLHLGIAGSAWGTVAAQGVSAACFVVLALEPSRRPRWPRREDLMRLSRDGAQIVARTVFLGLVLLSSTLLAARLGGVRLAAQQIVMQTWLTLSLAVDALAVPAQVFVSAALGAADFAAARTVGARCMRLGLLAGSAIGVVLLASSAWLPLAFSSDAAVQRAASVALVVCALQQPAAAIAFVLDGLLLGASDYAYLSRAMVIALAVFAPLAALSVTLPALGLAGVWAAIGCWLATRSVVLWRRWRREPWARSSL